MLEIFKKLITILKDIQEIVLVKKIIKYNDIKNKNKFFSLLQKTKKFGVEIRPGKITNDSEATDQQYQYFYYWYDHYQKILQNGKTLKNLTRPTESWKKYKGISFV